MLAACEVRWPRRVLHAKRARRWFTNLSFVALGGLVVRAMAALSIPIAGIAAAIYAQSHDLGLLHGLATPIWLNWIVTIIALDFAIWLQHLVSHKFPLFWKFHQVHHSDLDIDVSTALRFHPVEIALSMLWKAVCVLMLGALPAAVLVFEILLNATAMATHANIALPQRADRMIRAVFVTPDMHRIHHSIIRSEHDSNYGFNLAIWDRLFGTLTEVPLRGHDGMSIGLSEYRTEAPTRLSWSLILPFRRPKPM